MKMSDEATKNAPPPGGPIPPPPGADMEGGTGRPESVFRGLSDVQQWKKDDWMKKGMIVLRALALLFSFLSFIVMVALDGFDNYESLNYVLAIAIIAMVYTAVQTGIKVHELRTGKSVIPPEVATWFDFSLDQIMAYMLLSSASAATAIVNAIRKSWWASDTGIHHASAAISMSYLAFFSLAPAALISGYYLACQLSS